MNGESSPQFIQALTRRTFLGGGAAALAASAVAAPAAAELNLAAGSGYWLGERYWGNRLQDWLTRAGRMECVAEEGLGVGRTIAILTHEIQAGDFDLSVRTGTLAPGAGLSGFVIGTGVPGEDARRRVLLGSASGTGGGLIAFVDHNGAVGFRDHTPEGAQFTWPIMPAETTGTGVPRDTLEDLTLTISCRPVDAATVRLRVAVRHTGEGDELTSATIPALPLDRVRGGIAMMSSSREGSESRFWFTGVSLSGAGLAVIPDRALGPVMGTLFTCMGGSLRMTVQCMPVDPRDLSAVSLELRRPGGWVRVGTREIGPGYTAQFVVNGMKTAAPTGYRLVAGKTILYGGTVPASPKGGLRIASLSCVKASHRPLDSQSPWEARLPGGVSLDLYSRRNIYFPHNELIDTISSRKPDLVVAHGDQLYESSPTRKDPRSAPELDFLYKFLLWHWAMRPLTRRLPTVVMTDDHDVYQGNLWGEGGVATTDQNTGGYVNDPAWVNLVHRMNSWHNPKRFDPTPIAQGISVGYAAFSYGGVSFAIVEDRKFKTGPAEPRPAALQLLGARQEAFLTKWATMHRGLPKVILTGTTWACVQTDVDGLPRRDEDSNGWPVEGRNRAVRLARKARALIVAGDQHVGHLVRHGIKEFGDGPMQFTPPAGSTSFQRWFQPAEPLGHPAGTPNTGDFTDAFGNRVRVLAVANPKFTLRQLWDAYPPPHQDFGDRTLKREGFGLIAFDHARRTVRLECWPWHAAETGTGQFDGWPVSVPYSAL